MTPDRDARTRNESPALLAIISVGAVVYFGLLALISWHTLLPEPAAAATNVGMIAATLLFATLMYFHAVLCLGPTRATAFLLVCVVVSYPAEVASVRFDWLYESDLVYHDVLGWKPHGVPVLMPLAWFMMMYPAYIIANLIGDLRLTFGSCPAGRVLWLSVISAVVMTAWDLSQDPYSVHSMHAWSWLSGGEFFGIPRANFRGWILVTLFTNLAYRSWERRIPHDPPTRMVLWLSLIPVLVYVASGIFNVIATVPTDVRLLPPFTMGIASLLAVRRLVGLRGRTDDLTASSVVSRPTVIGSRPWIRFLVMAAWFVLLAVLVEAGLALRPPLDGAHLPFLTMAPIFAVASLASGWLILGGKRILVFFLLCVVLCYLAEVVGVATGVPFGRYSYADGAIGTKWLHVPWTVPLAWFSMMLPSYVITNLLVDLAPTPHPRPEWHRYLWLVGVGALVMTAWDLALDPYMVSQQGAWTWLDVGSWSFLGVPFSNYGGWLLVTGLFFLIYRLTDRYLLTRGAGRRVPIGSLRELDGRPVSGRFRTTPLSDTRRVPGLERGLEALHVDPAAALGEQGVLEAHPVAVDPGGAPGLVEGLSLQRTGEEERHGEQRRCGQRGGGADDSARSLPEAP